MGGGTSVYFKTTGLKDSSIAWSAKEVDENRRAELLQNESLKFILNHFYHDSTVPVRFTKKSADPKSPLWIEPSPDVFNVDNSESSKLLDCVPTGVLVDAVGNMKVLFSLHDFPLEFKISKAQVDAYATVLRSAESLPPPAPPTLLKDSVSQSTLAVDLSVNGVLPFPVGIVQVIECQYHRVTDEEEESSNFRWTVMRSRHYYRKGFLQEGLSQQRPGSSFRFRVRYSTNSSGSGSNSSSFWSPFSPPSAVYRTLPGVPSPPESLRLAALTSNSAHATWDAWDRCQHLLNGAKFLEFILIGRFVGGEFSVLYRGSKAEYLAAGLYPEYAYSFQLAVVNTVGQSEFSPPVSFHTPVRPKGRPGFSPNEIAAASECADAWVELWDGQEERRCYFNTLVSIRQVNMPEAWRYRADSGIECEPQVSDEELRKEQSQKMAQEQETQFRVKRFKVLRQLHAMRSRQSLSRSPGSIKARNEVLNLVVRRSHLLADAFQALSKLSAADAMKRLRVTFTGEQGVDSGGLGKEFFLLLSQQASLYMGPKLKGWMVAVAGEGKDGFFFCHSSNSTSSGDGSRNIGHHQLFAECIAALEGLPEFSEAAFIRFFGRLLGKAIMDRQLVDVALSWPLLRHMLGGIFEDANASPVSRKTSSTKASNSSLRYTDETVVRSMLSSIERLDSELFKSLSWILDHKVDGVVFETFSVEVGQGPSLKVLPLCDNGDKLEVSDTNKTEYVQLMLLWKLHYGVVDRLDPFLQGFHELALLSVLKGAGVSAAELNLMLVGKEEVNVNELRAFCKYSVLVEEGMKEGEDDVIGFGEAHDLVVWLWRYLAEEGDAVVRNCLRFFTGSSRVPLDGFDPPITISFSSCSGAESLPVAHTCFNQLVLPRYSNYLQMKKKLEMALHNSEGFELA